VKIVGWETNYKQKQFIFVDF